MVGGCTPTFDRHHGVVAVLGDRFLLIRLADADMDKSGMLALAHVGRETEMRAELAAALSGVVAAADLTKVTRPLSDDEQRHLVALAAFTVRARTGVERDGYHQEVLVLPQSEGPGRFVTALRRLLGGLEAIGCTERESWRVVHRVALDCVPALRLRLIRQLLAAPGESSTAAFSVAAGLAKDATKRHLEDLTLLGLTVHSKSSAADNAHDRWSATDLLRRLWPANVAESRDGVHTDRARASERSKESTCAEEDFQRRLVEPDPDLDAGDRCTRCQQPTRRNGDGGNPLCPDCLKATPQPRPPKGRP